MIVDIEGREIVIGDECYMPGSNRIYRIRIAKETPKAIHYHWKIQNRGDWSTHTTYTSKSAMPAKNLVKIC